MTVPRRPDLNPLLQPGARIGLSPATHADPALGRLPGAHMHLLESPRELWPSVAAALRDAASGRGLSAYPDPQYKALKAAIAREADTSPEHIALAAGSSELIDRTLRLFCAVGDEVVTTQPTWSFFHAFVQRWQLNATSVPMRGTLQGGDLQHDLDGLLAAITPRTRLVYLVNPCNPTGAALHPAALASFVQRLPAHVVVLIDEAYLQYADESFQPALSSVVDRCAARLVLLRTFSKFFGLAGLRLGYAVARPDTVSLLSHAEMPFAISAPAVVAAQAALADAACRQEVFEANRQGRQQLLDGLGALGLPAQPSQTHFVLLHAPWATQALRDELLAHGLVLPRAPAFPRHSLLLAVGRPEHKQLILDCLAHHAGLAGLAPS
jgi:histidinol-phosphate aminotransferase